ncbi:Bromodomain containing protein [Trichomonas vaginalis G3]|uniref:Bromodomain containing protein n=1 Tax=Trichomonas vaginalis (strain ATCC PRA-98 / G3) TaxID=412133 RepID=A2DTT1_TRIV3|nr:bromodomain extra-terminal-containing protein [Trichomonas vaginalis G3]EAY16228.1 Bromodomain containing protein [Trichomonas vaginalis G3]KAI5493267.1 bromodomain extra-terminal-containing protein [Trichomonas vaginalis G3]|eukprot:XP_001328451.1 Bromodomain containing protein [Trichomonas vaginalis G3]
MKEIAERPISQPFFQPLVDDQNYPKIFPPDKQMDFSKIKEKLEQGRYESLPDWIKDVNLIWANAATLPKESLIRAMADDLKSWFNDKGLKLSKKYVPRIQEESWLKEFENIQSKYKRLMDTCPVKLNLLPPKPEQEKPKN